MTLYASGFHSTQTSTMENNPHSYMIVFVFDSPPTPARAQIKTKIKIKIKTTSKLKITVRSKQQENVAPLSFNFTINNSMKIWHKNKLHEKNKF